MLTMETTRLIERCRQGEADALRELYEAYAQRMRGVCRRYVSDEQTVDDVLHDAFVIIFTSFDRLRDDSKAEAWMTAITRNVAAKCKDRQKHLSSVPLEVAESVVAPSEEKSVKGVPLEEVLRMIDRLPEGYGRVFRLSVFEGMSHKEIAAMLGIEPHSSSSQLARAKKILRKMMKQYRVAVLLLLLIPLSLFLFRKATTALKDEKPVVAKQKESPKDSRTEPPGQRSLAAEELREGPSLSIKEQRLSKSVLPHQPVHRTTIITADTLQPAIAQAVDSITADTSLIMVAQELMNADSIAADTTKVMNKMEIPPFDIADLSPERPAIDTDRQQKWSVNLAYVGGMGEQNYDRPYGFTETPLIAPVGEPISPVTFQNWSDYAAFLAEFPDDGSHSRSVIMNIALNNASDASGTGTDKIVRKSHHYMPVSFSLAMKHQLNGRFGLETGLSYSRLRSEFVMGSEGNTINEQQTIHYLGVPVRGICNIFTGKALTLYGSLGVTTEIPVHSSFNTSYYLHGILEATDETTLSVPWQWSVGTGVGLQYNFTLAIGLFIEPSLQYHIPTGSSLETYRTAHPCTFSLPLGIRFTW